MCLTYNLLKPSMKTRQVKYFIFHSIYEALKYIKSKPSSKFMKLDGRTEIKDKNICCLALYIILALCWYPLVTEQRLVHYLSVKGDEFEKQVN